MEQVLDQTRRKFSVPAIAVLVISRDDSPAHAIQGTRVSGQNNPATTRDYFHIGSCSKSVLAVISGRLIDAGKLDWNTKFFDVFPELIGGVNGVFQDITVTDLFKGEAGIQKYDSEQDVFPTIDPASENPRLEFVRFLIKQSPASARLRNGTFKPLHSNASFTMVAAMLEKITGDRWEEMVRRTLTEDLGIDMHIGWPNSLGIDQPWGHIIRNKRAEAFPPDHPYKLHDLIAPAGNLSMTAESFARYVEFHLEGLRGMASGVCSGTAEIEWICWIGLLERSEYLGEEPFEHTPERVSHTNVNGYKA